jgi:hypothetical protein
LQEAVGLDVITDGEMRREGWNAPLRVALSGFTAFPGGTGYRWRTGDPKQNQVREDQGRTWPFVTEHVQVQRDVAQTEYAFLRAHARQRPKYCLPAPSYYRTQWHEARSRQAYPTAEEFPEFQALMEAQGRRGAIADLRFDVALDSSVFEGGTGITHAVSSLRNQLTAPLEELLTTLTTIQDMVARKGDAYGSGLESSSRHLISMRWAWTDSTPGTSKRISAFWERRYHDEDSGYAIDCEACSQRGQALLGALRELLLT